MIKNMIDSRRVLGADATTDTEGVARRQAVSGSLQSQDYGRPQVYLNHIIGSRDKKRMNPFNDLQPIIRFYLLPNVVMGWESLSLPPTVT